MANPSTFHKDHGDGSVLFFDNAGPAGANTFSATDVRAISVDVVDRGEPVVIRVRKVVKTVRDGDDPIYEISFQVPVAQFTNGSQDVLLDVLTGEGNISGSWTKDWSQIEGWNFGMRLTVEGTTHGDGADHTLTFRGCRCTAISFQEGEEDVFDVTVQSFKRDGYAKSGPA